MWYSLNKLCTVNYKLNCKTKGSKWVILQRGKPENVEVNLVGRSGDTCHTSPYRHHTCAILIMLRTKQRGWDITEMEMFYPSGLLWFITDVTVIFPLKSKGIWNTSQIASRNLPICGIPSFHYGYYKMLLILRNLIFQKITQQNKNVWNFSPWTRPIITGNIRGGSKLEKEGAINKREHQLR